MNNIKELLHMFWASAEIQEKYMYESETNSYKETYRSILDVLKDNNPEMSNSIECKVFNLAERWWNDLHDICEKLVQEELGNYNRENHETYMEKYVKKYIDQYFQIQESKSKIS